MMIEYVFLVGHSAEVISRPIANLADIVNLYSDGGAGLLTSVKKTTTDECRRRVIENDSSKLPKMTCAGSTSALEALV